MREYRIKRGHDADVGQLISSYFDAKGDIYKGIEFTVEGMGDITMRQEKNSLFIEIWNTFLFEATGKDTKERKKDFGKIK